MMKLSAASPQYCLSQSMFASKPPAATTTAFARISWRWPLHASRTALIEDAVLDGEVLGVGSRRGRGRPSRLAVS